MSPDETLALCRLVKAVCPSQALDQYTPDAWHLILRHIDYNDAKQAVIDIASRPLEPSKSRYIEPGHIIGDVRRIRSQRIEDYGPVSPPAGLDTAVTSTACRAGGRPEPIRCRVSRNQSM